MVEWLSQELGGYMPKGIGYSKGAGKRSKKRTFKKVNKKLSNPPRVKKAQATRKAKHTS
jgi:hypothetical protein